VARGGQGLVQLEGLAMKAHALLILAALALSGSAAQAVQYPYLDPAYVQEICTGPLVGGPAGFGRGGADATTTQVSRAATEGAAEAVAALR